MTAETDLLPCPFCGSENIDPKGWASTDSAGPACDDCGACAGGVRGTLQDNIAAWNRRAQAAEVEALRAEVERVTCELMDATTRADKLAEALRLALDSHGVMLMTDPPQDAWKVHRVEEIGRALLRDQEEGK